MARKIRERDNNKRLSLAQRPTCIVLVFSPEFKARRLEQGNLPPIESKRPRDRAMPFFKVLRRTCGRASVQRGCTAPDLLRLVEVVDEHPPPGLDST